MYGDTDFDKAKAYSAQVAAATAAAAQGQTTAPDPSVRRDRRLQTVTDITAILQSFLPAQDTATATTFQPSTASDSGSAPTTPWGKYALIGVGAVALLGGAYYISRR